jgi:hypothetical protein
MVPKSTMVSVGNLTFSNVPININDLRWTEKKIVGFMLNRYLSEIDDNERNKLFKIVSDDLSHDGGRIFKTEIIKTIKLDEWEKHIEESGNVGTDGKYSISCE